MAKIEELSTFNLDGKTYSISSLSVEARDLLKVYLETEDDILKHKVALVKSQHALASMGNMFRDMIKEIAPIDPAELAKQQAAEVLAAVKAANDTPSSKPRAGKKAAVRK